MEVEPEDRRSCHGRDGPQPEFQAAPAVDRREPRVDVGLAASGSQTAVWVESSSGGRSAIDSVGPGVDTEADGVVAGGVRVGPAVVSTDSLGAAQAPRARQSAMIPATRAILFTLTPAVRVRGWVSDGKIRTSVTRRP